MKDDVKRRCRYYGLCIVEELRTCDNLLLDHRSHEKVLVMQLLISLPPER